MKETAATIVSNWLLRCACLGIVGVSTALSAPAIQAQPAARATVQFNRDIRPLLSDNCYHCHGPDQAQRQAELRLDVRQDTLADRGGYQVVVPADPQGSELYRRLTSNDDQLQMPPPDSGKSLTTQQIELIRRWIEQGAPWQEHWAFITAVRPPLPQVQRSNWPRNAIDYFILARLEQEGLPPSPEAEPETLIRRVSLDLSGLPPTPAEIDAFLNDRSPDAYEKLVDRLLASPRFGERMSATWLDAARFADTSGYQNDGPRYMWRWRDWVINALNENMPFDQFTIEQIAGDMLPQATLEQRIATGFNRNHRGNAEGGIIPEEYAVEYVVDRVDTTATVWLGLTMGCARCHDHKYDPISQKEFYQVFAYFNNIAEHGRAIKEGNSPPMMKAPTLRQQEQLEQLQRQLEEAERTLAALGPQIDKAQSAWENNPGQHAEHWLPDAGLLAHYPLDTDTSNTAGKGGKSAFVAGSAAFAPGVIGRAAEFDGSRYVDGGDVARFGYFDKFSLAAWIYPQATAATIVSRMQDTARDAGYYLRWQDGRVQVNLVKRWLDDAIRVETQRQLPPNQWYHLAVTYDGSRVARGIRVYVDGQLEPLRVNLDGLNQTFATDEPLRIGGGGGPENVFQGRIDDLRIYDRAASADEVAILATGRSIAEILAASPAQRTARQSHKLRTYFLAHHAPDHVQSAFHRVAALRQAKADLFERIPTVMVMQEMAQPRDAFVLIRGQYDKPGEKVLPGVPSVLPPLPAGAPNNRLGFARWLVSADNPLTPRVAVNRFWQLYFGSGLVKTTEDFGTQGDRPSHPELMDWLASEFVHGGWDVKALQKLIVMSATYRQSSGQNKLLSQKDPSNRLLARGPRFRLPAEMIRDQALLASGLFVERCGGPSVKPYQPEGLWKEIATDGEYHQSHGADLYRRSLYIYWKRTVAPPNMMAFDASNREMCSVRQTRTNTPLQALALMNDPTFLEAARVLAQRVMKEGQTGADQRLALAFRLATARHPKPQELRILLAGLDFHWQRYRSDQQAAQRLVETGEYPLDQQLDVAELAAYTAISSVILNLDEVITKQ